MSSTPSKTAKLVEMPLPLQMTFENFHLTFTIGMENVMKKMITKPFHLKNNEFHTNFTR